MNTEIACTSVTRSAHPSSSLSSCLILCVTANIFHFFLEQEHFVYPVAARDTAPETAGGSCGVCGTPFSDSCPQPRLRLHRPAIKLVSSVFVLPCLLW